MRKKYVPDLKQASALYETNFLRMQRIMPSDVVDGKVCIALHDGNCDIGRVEFRITEEFSYTRTVECLYVPVELASRYFLVRMYLDASMAEVVQSPDARQLNGVYPYPNESMFQKDEKLQQNEWLSEILSLCLKHGYLRNKIDDRDSLTLF